MFPVPIKKMGTMFKIEIQKFGELWVETQPVLKARKCFRGLSTNWHRERGREREKKRKEENLAAPDILPNLLNVAM